MDIDQEHILIGARPRDSDSPDRLRQEFFEAAVRGLENALRRIGLGPTSSCCKTTGSLAAASDAEIDGQSVSGDIRLDFASEPMADFDVQTLSGDINNCFGPKPVEPRHGPGKRLTFKTGETSARVHLTTNSGDVRLCTKK